MDSELTETSDGPMFTLNDIKSELEKAAQTMAGSQKITMMLVEYSTPQFKAYVSEGKECDTLPQTPARDFFLHSLKAERFCEGIDSSFKAVVERELSKLCHRLDVRRVEFALEPEDWLSMTKIIMACLIKFYRSKGELPKFIRQIESNLGTLSEQEELSLSFLISLA